MRILHYLDLVRATIGGPARAVVDLCETLARRGHEVTLVCDDDEGVPASWRTGDPAKPRSVLTGLRLDAKGRSFGPMRPWREMRDLVARADVVHIHGVWEPTKPRVASICRAMGKPYVVSLRGQLDDWCMAQGALKKRVMMGLAARRMLEGAAFVHCTAQAELDQSGKHFPRGRGIVISNLLDLRPFETLPGPGAARAKFPVFESGRPNLLFLSRVHVKKGLDVLLRAGALLRSRGVDANILIAGSGDEAYVESVKRLVTELGLSDRAHFLGLVVNEEKLSLYRACDLFVLPTSQENFGFVFVESLACGTPVVTTRGVDIWPELQSSGGAVIAEATPEAIAGAVGSLLADRDALPAMGAKGREWVFKDLAPEKVIREFEAMYERAKAKAPQDS
ncbi:MAG: glycosyltransferase [Phycisphaerae bacterium]|nr:glycosyltransferase [Phycisphaerae bacterium]